jgi:integrase
MGRVTAKMVKALERPGRYGDGGTLYLVVAPGGSKSWVQRLTIGGTRRDLGLGGFPLVTLAEAREQAFDNRRQARRGRNPLADRRRAATPTFEQAAGRALEANRARWRNAKTATNWTESMTKHAFPVFGSQRVDQIGREDVLRVLTPIWTSKPELARKIRQRIRATLQWAMAHGHVDRNVAGEAIDGALPAMPAVAAHFRALPYGEVRHALELIDASRASLSAKACLRFVALTACRSGEARGATWDEVDLESREWRIPAARMKAEAEHRIPLSDAALAVLESVGSLRDRSDLLFPSPQRSGRPLSDMTLTKVLRDTGLAGRATVHGFRASFRTWASERTSVPHAVAEIALAHAVGSSVERSYARSDLFDKRCRLMDQWAEYVVGDGAKVLRLQR